LSVAPCKCTCRHQRLAEARRQPGDKECQRVSIADGIYQPPQRAESQRPQPSAAGRARLDLHLRRLQSASVLGQAAAWEAIIFQKCSTKHAGWLSPAPPPSAARDNMFDAVLQQTYANIWRRFHTAYLEQHRCHMADKRRVLFRPQRRRRLSLGTL